MSRRNKYLKIAIHHDIMLFGRNRVRRIINMLSGESRKVYTRAYLEVINGK